LQKSLICSDAKWFVDRTLAVPELKIFVSLRISLDALVYWKQYEFDWRNKDNLIAETPGINKIMARERFSAVLSLFRRTL